MQHGYIGTEHLLLGLLRVEDEITTQLLIGLEVELGKVRSAVESIIGRGDQPATGTLHPTPRAKKVLVLAGEEAQRLDRDRPWIRRTCSWASCAKGKVLPPGCWRAWAPSSMRCARPSRCSRQTPRASSTGRGQMDIGDASGSSWWEQAGIRTRVGQSLRRFFSGPRDNVLSIRVDDGDVAAIDALVEAGVLKTRSETAAWLIKSGIEANRDLFEQVQEKTAEIRRLREETQELIHRHVAGAASGAGESPEPADTPDEDER